MRARRTKRGRHPPDQPDHPVQVRIESREIRKLIEEVEKERERSKGLVGRIAIMEANVARLGFDPEEMHKPILKPVRTMSRAGQGGAGGIRKRSRTIGQL